MANGRVRVYPITGAASVWSNHNPAGLDDLYGASPDGVRSYHLGKTTGLNQLDNYAAISHAGARVIERALWVKKFGDIDVVSGNVSFGGTLHREVPFVDTGDSGWFESKADCNINVNSSTALQQRILSGETTESQTSGVESSHIYYRWCDDAIFNGLQNRWDLNDEGNWHDSAGSWDATNSGSVTVDEDGGPGGGGAANFPANTSHLDLGSKAWNGSGAARSIEVWVNFAAFSSIGNWLYSHRGSESSTRIHQVLCHKLGNPDYVLGVDFFDGAGVFARVTTASVLSPPALDTWYHLVATTNGVDEHKLYLDGSLCDTQTTTLDGEVISSLQPARMGVASWSQGTDSLRHDGLLANVSVWDRVLSSSEATFLYNGGLGREYQGLCVDENGTILKHLMQLAV